MRAQPRAWHAGAGSLPGHRTALAWPLLCWTLAVSPVACAQAPAPRIEVAGQENYTVNDPRPIPRIEPARPITIEFLNQEYGPLPPCVLRVLEPLLETGTARIREEHEDDPRFSERTWKIAVGEETYEVKEKLFEGEPIHFSVIGRFYFDPLRDSTFSTPLCLTFSIGSWEHRAELFTCDAATVERAEKSNPDEELLQGSRRAAPDPGRVGRASSAESRGWCCRERHGWLHRLSRPHL